MKVYFLTGASGVGKTTLVKNLLKKYGEESGWQFLHFDSIGVPTVEVMIEEYGSTEGWQEAMTHKWIDKIQEEHADKKIVVLEGQAHPKFVQAGFQKYGFGDYELVLVDCSEEDMCFRLTHERGQEELVNQDMKNWLKCLRDESERLDLRIFDTTAMSEEEVVEAFEGLVGI